MDAFDWLAMRRLEDKAGCELLGCLAGLIACGLGLIVVIAATIMLALTMFHAPDPRSTRDAHILNPWQLSF